VGGYSPGLRGSAEKAGPVETIPAKNASVTHAAVQFRIPRPHYIVNGTTLRHLWLGDNLHQKVLRSCR